MIGERATTAGPGGTIPLVPLFRLSAKRSIDAATGIQKPVFETELVEYGDWDSFEQVAEAALRHGDGIYEFGSPSNDFLTEYIQVRKGFAIWRRTALALRKVVERDCGRKQPLPVAKLWLRRTEVKNRIVSDLVSALLPTDAPYAVRVHNTVIGSEALVSHSSVFFGLHLDAEACDDVGDRIGTIHVDGMIAIRAEQDGRFHRVDCIELGELAPRLVVRYVLVDQPAGLPRKRIVASSSSREDLLRAAAQLEKSRELGEANSYESAEADDGPVDDRDNDYLRSFSI